jgi:CheY-like chemotaxis protein
MILELGVSEPLTGRDVISRIKATMEGRISLSFLYTSLPIGSHQEARTAHGADDVIRKESMNADMLLARVVQIFQRED